MNRSVAICIVSLAFVACANAPGLDALDGQANGNRSVAVLFVEQQGTAGSTFSHVGGRFVRYSGIAPDALPDLIGTPRLPASGTICTERTDITTMPDARSEARLLDVGSLTVRTDDRVVQLEPRRFPDLGNVVSGVIYASDEMLSGEHWHFSAPGNEANRMAGFEADAQAPSALSDVTVADQRVDSNTTETLGIPRRGYSVRWAHGSHDDAVTVSFEGVSRAGQPVSVVCTTRDDGLLDIDAVSSDRIASLFGDGTNATLTVHRMRTRPFEMANMDSGTLVFDFSVRTPVTFTPAR